MGAVVLTAGCVQTPGRSGPYPDGDIDLIVPAEAGDVTDTVARAVAPCLADRLGVDVAVRNRPGENGVLGNRALVDAEPDGHTLMISSVGPSLVTPLLLPERDYGSDDFRFVGVVRSAPVVLFTAADSPVDSAETLLATAKAGGPPVTVANRGDTTVEGFALWHLNFMAETRLEPARTDSDAEILRGVVAGDFMAGLVTLTPELLAGIESGQLRPLASGGHERPAYLPEVPTTYEVLGRRFPDPAADPDLVIDTAFSAPKDVGDAATSTLSSALSRCLSTDDVQRGIGAEFVPADQGEPGQRRVGYRNLQHAVQLQLDMAEIEGR
ncbi:tripartite tricarboxylate transporter substrate binding protein [Actinophytocola glycyrrhizae]|uniref:Tripartite tricarboxylate transporter substrate binding protein n=1 Tax=Actinophytocola glycyrrhizae TaxID=2044873 RepID=A0ABV9S7R6_9PSEU